MLLVLSLLAGALPSEGADAEPAGAVAAGLPGGDEADGIVGDFVLTNETAVAVIAAALPGRQANLMTFWPGSAAGCLLDFTRHGEDNDQLTVFSPCSQQGPVSWVRHAAGPEARTGSVEVVVVPNPGGGVHRRHLYWMDPASPAIHIETWLRNDTAEPLEFITEDLWTEFGAVGTFEGIRWADAPDPARKAGYAYAPVSGGVRRGFESGVRMAPGECWHRERILAVGGSPAEALGVVAELTGPVGTLDVAVRDEAGEPVPSATVRVQRDGRAVPGYPDAFGNLTLRLPPGPCRLRVHDVGRPDVERDVEIQADVRRAVWVRLTSGAGIQFDIRDESDRSLPCKVQFFGRGGGPTPDLGPAYRAHGCVDQYHSETGRFRVQLAPGRYGVRVTRGPEYSHLSRTVEVAPGRTAQFSGTLVRLVDTTGWVSADFHSHSTPSGDSVCATSDRLANLAAEQIEFAPATEHNRICDWRPELERLGLHDWLCTVPGIELTGDGSHLNAFPFEVRAFTQGNGAPAWDQDPRESARRLRDHQGQDPDRWVQLNHPHLIRSLAEPGGADRPDAASAGLGALLDGVETQNGTTTDILLGAPIRIVRDAGREEVRYVREFQWLQLLNQGQLLRAIAVSDAHSVYGNGVGGWRTYLPSATDEPGRIDWRELTRHARAGRAILTTGPFLQVTANGSGGPGDTIRAAEGAVRLHVRVQCTDWLDIDRVQLLVNSRPLPEGSFTRRTHPGWFGSGVVRFDHEISLRLRADSHIIVVALGEESDLAKGFGSSEQSALRPCAYHNPLYVDVDGGGWRANGDTLGWPLVIPPLSLVEAEAWLRERARRSDTPASPERAPPG